MTSSLGRRKPRSAIDRFVAGLAIAQAIVVFGAFVLIGPFLLFGAMYGELSWLPPILGTVGGVVATLVGALRRGRGPLLIVLGAAVQVLGLLLLGSTGEGWWPLVVPGLALPVLLLTAAPLSHRGEKPSDDAIGRPTGAQSDP